MKQYPIQIQPIPSGETLAFRKCGNGAVNLVLLHGNMSSSVHYQPLMEKLEQYFTVYAVDLRGFGDSSYNHGFDSLRELAEDVKQFIGLQKIDKPVIMGWSTGGGVAMEFAILHPDKVRKVVIISAPLRRDGWVKEANDFWPNFNVEMMKGTPAETEREVLNPVPNSFPDFFNHIKAAAIRPYDFGSEKLKATKAPFFFINGDADGVRFDHIEEMYRLKGGGYIHGDMFPRSESRLAIIPNTTHVTLMNKMSVIVPMVTDFLDAKPPK